MDYEVLDTKYKIRSFTDLDAWRESHKLVLLVYKVTKSFPIEEIYSLVDQMRRSSVSVSSNIAEGFSRKGPKEKVQFYFTSKGSLSELENQVIISRDVYYLNQQSYIIINHQIIRVKKLLNGLIKFL